MKAEGKFTESLWSSVQTIYLDLINHPFVNQLVKGTLPLQCFAHYLSQDVLYIRDDSKALENLSKKATEPTEQDFFMTLANDGIAIEQELHNHYLKIFNVIEAKTKSPTIEGYTRFLIEHSEKSTYHIAAAALLPCFWVYNSVGKHIFTHAVENNAYQKWIETYQGGEYENYTKKFIQIVERLADNSNNNEKKLMQEAFVQATMFELNFFEESISK
ncbi:MAG: TenA family protein [Bacteroidales bacterium]|nr:TenA family protein [Bacteroidales bacterium]